MALQAPTPPPISRKPSSDGTFRFLSFNEKKQTILSKLKNNNTNLLLDDLIMVDIIAELDGIDYFADDVSVGNSHTQTGKSSVDYINNLSKPRFNRRKHRLVKPISIDHSADNSDSNRNNIAKRHDYIAKHNSSIREQRIRQIIERLVSDKEELMHKYQQTQLNQELFFKEKNMQVKFSLINQFVKIIINTGIQKVIDFQLVQAKKQEELFKMKLLKGSYIWSIWRKYKMKCYVKNILAHTRRVGRKKLKQERKEENEWRLRIAQRLITENSQRNELRINIKQQKEQRIPDYYNHFCYISQMNDLGNNYSTIPSLPPVYQYHFHSNVNEDELWRRAAVERHKPKILERQVKRESTKIDNIVHH